VCLLVVDQRMSLSHAYYSSTRGISTACCNVICIQPWSEVASS
jgi:hypothetical protein